MATDVLAGRWVELAATLIAAMTAELPPAAGVSPLEPLRSATGSTAAEWQAPLGELGLLENGELAPWLARSLSVLLWPEALVRTYDTVASAPATRFVAADTLVRYEQAEGTCLIGRPAHHDAFVDALVALCTTTVARPDDPPVLELSRWTLQAIDTVLATDRTRRAAHAALATLTSAPDDPDGILAAMLDDELLAETGDSFMPGPAIEGWSDALCGARRLELQRLDLADGPAAQVRTMVFIGTPGDRCLIVPQGGDEMLLVKPTVDEATVLIDAFLTPAAPAIAEDAWASIADAWRADAETLIAGGRR